jgi:hypothetical protein
MKKIYTLLLLFTITLFYSIPTQAYSLDANDIAITELNGLTLNEVFLDSQILTNPSFDNGLTSWNDGFTTTPTVSNSILSFIASASGQALFRNITTITSNKYYQVSNIKTTSTGIALINFSLIGDPQTLHSASGYYEILSIYETSDSDANNEIQVRQINTDYQTTFVDYVYLYNITSLGLTALTKARLDYWFNQWEFNNAYIDGYNQGELDGYADGLQDNTAYVQGYNVGYTDGLFGGSDMETGSSLLILIVALIGFVMMIFGFTTKRGIFNLLSVAAFVVLGTLLVEFVGFIIITIGLVIINIYYAFFGDI